MPDFEVTADQPTHFSTALPVIIYTRPEGAADVDWQEVDRGPGYFHVPAGQEIRVRAKGINDDELAELVHDLQDVAALRFFDLSENRNVTNLSMIRLKSLTQLTGMNLSSVSITSTGLEELRGMARLEYLNLSFCNRLTDAALKTLEAMRGLQYVDLQGIPGITNGGLARIRRRNLTLHR